MHFSATAAEGVSSSLRLQFEPQNLRLALDCEALHNTMCNKWPTQAWMEQAWTNNILKRIHSYF